MELSAKIGKNLVMVPYGFITPLFLPLELVIDR